MTMYIYIHESRHDFEVGIYCFCLSGLYVLKEEEGSSTTEQPNPLQKEVLKSDEQKQTQKFDQQILPNLDPYMKFDECTTIQEEEEAQQPRHYQDSSPTLLEVGMPSSFKHHTKYYYCAKLHHCFVGRKYRFCSKFKNIYKSGA